MAEIFLSTPSARRATAGAEIPATRSKHFYPRPPRGGRRYAPFRQHSPFHISIHALREEGDARQRRADRCAYISIHALREEGDENPRNGGKAAQNFYPRPPRGGRPSKKHKTIRPETFLSTPSARRATEAYIAVGGTMKFLSTPSARRATRRLRRSNRPDTHFYPRPPRGGRLSILSPCMMYGKFLSTPSARRATPSIVIIVAGSIYFYPRPPRGGRPQGRIRVPRTILYFYPRPPRGGRPVWRARHGSVCTFLSTPSARRATSSEFDGQRN